MIRVESDGSFWEIDEDLLRYRRFPKGEGGREQAEWSDDRAGLLEDFVWHPMRESFDSDHGSVPSFFVTEGWRAKHVSREILCIRTPHVDELTKDIVIAPNPIVLRGEVPQWP